MARPEENHIGLPAYAELHGLRTFGFLQGFSPPGVLGGPSKDLPRTNQHVAFPELFLSNTSKPRKSIRCLV
jgi:hypothetical protein